MSDLESIGAFRFNAMTFIYVFVATTWDFYFLLKDNFYKGKSVAEISLDIESHLAFLFYQQGREFPDISDMIKELKMTHLLPQNAFFDCSQKSAFVNKYTGESALN